MLHYYSFITFVFIIITTPLFDPSHHAPSPPSINDFNSSVTVILIVFDAFDMQHVLTGCVPVQVGAGVSQ